MANYIVEYYDKIMSGEIVTSKKIKQIYSMLVNDVNNPKEPYVFDIDLATRPILFIEKFCKHSEMPWAGKPVILELWQKAMIQSIYGFVTKDEKMRKYRKVFCLVGRKNGKSTLISALGIYGMIEEIGAQVVCVANSKDQTKAVFDSALHMVNKSAYLSKAIKKRKSDMFMAKTCSSYRQLASKSNNLDGLNVSLGILDECHENKDRNLYDVVVQSQSTRQQPLMFVISTNGFVRENFFDTLYNYGKNVLNGINDDESFLPFFYELDSRDEWTDEACWIKANPTLGTVKTMKYMYDNIKTAKADSTYLKTVLTKDFNIPETVGGSWLNFEDLNNTATFDLEMFRGSYCMGGVDLSDVGDLTCATIICMRRNDPVKYVHQMYFIPSETAEQKIKTDKVPYDIWRDKGYVTYCEGKKVNYSNVTKWFTDTVINEYGIIPMFIGYDYAMTRYWLDEMASFGFTDRIMTQVRQGFISVSPIMKEMDVDFQSKLINYNNNPVLKWCLSNTQVICDPAGNIKFDKRKNKHMRNDGMTSLYDAFKPLLDNFQNFQNMIKD